MSLPNLGVVPDRSNRRVGVVLVALALVTAGCSAPVAESGTESTTTPTPGGDSATDKMARGNATAQPPNITVLNGSLRVDPGVIFQRVQRLQGTAVQPPQQVRVFETSEAFANSTGGPGPRTPAFWRLVGLDTGEINGSDLEISKNGYVTGTGEVGIYVGPNATLAEERMVLAHEFTHYVQTQNGRRSDIGSAVGIGTTEARLLQRALVEGGAVFTADAYMREYTDNETRNSEWYPRIQQAYPPGHVGRLLNGRYIAGAAYVDARLSSPTGLAGVYENPPRTTEQLLHGDAPGEEPPTALRVETDGSQEWLPSGTDQYGELFVRYALESGVSPDRAARAAAGWGNDTLALFRSTEGAGTGYVWVLDWDSASNDTEFRRALTDALGARGNRSDGRWSLPEENVTARVVDVAPTTTALVLGPESFVTATTLSAQDETVTVSVAESRTEQSSADTAGVSATTREETETSSSGQSAPA